MLDFESMDDKMFVDEGQDTRPSLRGAEILSEFFFVVARSFAANNMSSHGKWK